MHVLITGAGGFVGSRLARRLLDAGERVSGLYFEEAGAPRPAGVWAHDVDILDAAGLRRAIQAADPDAVVHLAGLSHVGESWNRMGAYFRVNVLGTENLLSAAAGRRVVVASSAEVYGAVPVAEQPIGERREVDPHTPYALTKAAAERLALAAGAVIVRCFNLVGPGQSERFALPGFAAQLAAIAARAATAGVGMGGKEAVLQVGNLSARRDFLHVDDGVEAYWQLVRSGRPGEVYNAASGQAHEMREALDRLMAISGVRARVETDPQRMRTMDLPLLVGDAGRLRALGWEPRRSLDDALADLWTEAVARRRQAAETN